ncbi:hypothetical protein [Kordia sp.]|uniref:hypothetical protein n=1 Tax=Kordia sp. TaxID=1965332 RepID=UPI003B5ACE01
MSSSTLQAEVFINETNDGHASSGYLEIVTTEDILIDNIVADIQFEARGRMRGYQNNIATVPIILEPTLVKANEENILPFTFELRDENIESYEGVNVSFIYTCEVTIYVNKEDFKKLGLNFLSSVKSFMTSDRRLRTLKQFEVKDLQNAYKVTEGLYGFNLEMNYAIPVFTALILFLGYVLFIPEFNTGYLIIGIVIIILTTIFVQSFIKSSLGKLTMDLEDDEGNFRCTIGKTKKFNLKEQTLYYEIIEEVTDRRGTKTSTSTKVVHTSEHKTMNNFKRNAVFDFPYVDSPDYECLQMKDVSFYWQMNIVGVSNLGLKLKYTSKFEVKKSKPISAEGLVKF